MANRVLIRNAQAVVTCDPSDRVIKNGDILIEDGKIISLGSALAPVEKAEIIDASGKFVYPGLVNTHHHFFQTFVRNVLAIDFPALSLVEWLYRVYPVFKEVSSDVIYYASLTAMADLLKHGCTCAFDHQYCYTKKTGKTSIDRQMEAAQLLGIRFHAGRGCNTLPREEGSPIPDEMLETTGEFITDCERLIGLYHDPKPFSMTRIVVAPCQPVNCYPETFIESAAFARDRGVRLHTHLAEGENAIMKNRWGKRTLAWAEDIGFLGPDLWIAHGWELTPDEYQVVARAGVGISHCPAPAILIGGPIIDMPAMIRAGITLSLGCDGSTTNDSSNLLDSLRIAYLMQCFHRKQRGNAPSPYDLLKIATINGAGTLGREELGSLEAGKGADLFMVDTDVLELSGTHHDPKNLLAHVGCTGPVWLTMVNGKVVYHKGELTGIDEQALAAKAEAVCTESLRSLFPAIFA
ncbi:MAG: amidohydrolase [Spirochaetaceae bacterium]|jgi:hydroxyatrazine ethylaminohydrolase|nr:amidohydrolase [Spirochaetaceae bacterium]